MTIHSPGWIWLNDHDVCSAGNLLEVSGLSMQEFDELVDIGVIEPVDDGAQIKSFHLHYIVTATTARRLRDAFDLDLQSIGLTMKLVQRISELQAELTATQARLHRHQPAD